MFSVRHFGMKLNSKDWQVPMLHTCIRTRFGRSDRVKRTIQLADLISVAHPRIERVGDALKQSVVSVLRTRSSSEFSGIRWQNLASQHVTNNLHPIADTENRKSKVEDRRINLWSSFSVHAGWTAGKD